MQLEKHIFTENMYGNIEKYLFWIVLIISCDDKIWKNTTDYQFDLMSMKMIFLIITLLAATASQDVFHFAWNVYCLKSCV